MSLSLDTLPHHVFQLIFSELDIVDQFRLGSASRALKSVSDAVLFSRVIVTPQRFVPVLPFQFTRLHSGRYLLVRSSPRTLTILLRKRQYINVLLLYDNTNGIIMHWHDELFQPLARIGPIAHAFTMKSLPLFQSITRLELDLVHKDAIRLSDWNLSFKDVELPLSHLEELTVMTSSKIRLEKFQLLWANILTGRKLKLSKFTIKTYLIREDHSYKAYNSRLAFDEIIDFEHLNLLQIEAIDTDRSDREYFEYDTFFGMILGKGDALLNLKTLNLKSFMAHSPVGYRESFMQLAKHIPQLDNLSLDIYVYPDNMIQYYTVQVPRYDVDPRGVVQYYRTLLQNAPLRFRDDHFIEALLENGALPQEAIDRLPRIYSKVANAPLTGGSYPIQVFLMILGTFNQMQSSDQLLTTVMSSHSDQYQPHSANLPLVSENLLQSGEFTYETYIRRLTTNMRVNLATKFIKLVFHALALTPYKDGALAKRVIVLNNVIIKFNSNGDATFTLPQWQCI